MNAEEYTERARELLQEALDEVDRDVIPEVTEALTCLYLAEDERPGMVILNAAEYEREPEGECICPPDLLARGGFKGRCPIHAT